MKRLKRLGHVLAITMVASVIVGAASASAQITGIYIAGAQSANPEEQPRIISDEPSSFASNNNFFPTATFNTLGTNGPDFSCNSYLYTSLPSPVTKIGIGGPSECTHSLSSGWGVMNLNSCQYELEVNNLDPPYTGTIGVTCSKAGDKIEYKAYLFQNTSSLLCTVKLGAQKGVAGVELANVFNGPNSAHAIAVAMDANLQGLSYELTGSNCAATTGSYSNGTSLMGDVFGAE